MAEFPNSRSPTVLHAKTASGLMYFCDICGKGFPYPSNLENHKRIHTGIKPFACEFCDKRCRTKSNLKSHVMHSHVKDIQEYSNC